jgi:hypothetical protein
LSNNPDPETLAKSMSQTEIPWGEFEKLRRSWTARPGGCGGMYALAGFSFQLGSALLAIVRLGKWDGRATVFLEALSDIVSADEDCLVVTQAKRTLSSGSIRSALAELWDIYRLAEAETPALARRLRYRVLATQATLKDLKAAIERWQPSEPAAPGDVTRFIQRLAIDLSPEPRQQLAVHLVNAFGVDDPFARVDRWLGRLLSDPSPDGLDQSCRDVFIELSGLQAGAREREHLFHIWSELDRPPSSPELEPDENRATLTGQTPDRKHLIEGRFARRWFYDGICDDAETWLGPRGRRNDGRLSSYWIAGRSGAGKSVALLHLLADLHERDRERVIIWLHQQADRMADAVRWARPFFAEGMEVILAADDPFTPERYQRVTVAIERVQREFDSIVVAYPEALRPALLLCGPTEQGQAFEDDLADRVVVKSFTLQPETRRDFEELKAWYTQRTGRTHLPVGDTEDVLIVQLFFEWATGQPLAAFAQRFRKRLQGLSGRASSRSIFDLVAEILALNRLYALFPTEAVNRELEADPEIGRAFDRLRDLELHFTFDAEWNGFRLTHPHLANAIYTAWFGRDDDRRQRKKHLRAGIEAALATGSTPQQRFAPLWAISRLAWARRAPGDAAQRIELIKAEMHELLTEIYASNFSLPPNPLSELPVWVSLDALLELSLTPSPLNSLKAAVEGAPIEARGLRLSCHMLLQQHEVYREGVGAVRDLLNRYRHWIEWPAVAADYLAKVGSAGIEDSLRDFVSREWMRAPARSLVRSVLVRGESGYHAIALSWLEAAPSTEPMWSGVLTQLIDRSGLCEQSAALGWQLLRSLPEDPSWSHVWERLHEQSAEERERLEEVAEHWLEIAPPDISGWDRVWEALWARAGGHSEKLRRGGLKWLDDVSSGHGSWQFIWGKLWTACGGTDEQLRVRGRRWLDEASSEHGSWTYMWETLWQGRTGDEDLSARGRRWLDEVPGAHRSWKYVWDELWKASSGKDGELYASARRWLAEAPASDPSWQFLWQDLWRAANHDDPDRRSELRTIGRDWMAVAPVDHQSWGYMWVCLWEDAPGDADLVERGERWLYQAPVAHLSWAAVWKRLWDASGKRDPGLLAHARRWLNEAPAEHPSWREVWADLRGAEGSDEAELLARARQWLDEVSPDHPSWKYMWVDLRAAAGDDQAELLDRGRQWLDETSPGHLSWKYVWDDLRAAPGSDEAELRARGRRWLDETPPDHPSWKYMWENLWQACRGNDESLLVRGRRWLDETSPDHPSWKYMWQNLREACRGDDESLLVRGRQWLDQAPRHGSWAYLWSELRRARGTDKQDLTERGRQWLAEATDHPSWGFVFGEVWSATGGRDAQLLSMAREWLERMPRSPGWAHVWRHLMRAGGAGAPRESLVTLGADWLDTDDAIGASWPIVWQVLWLQSDLDSPRLQAAASRLLVRAPPKYPDSLIRAANGPRPSPGGPSSPGNPAKADPATP